MPDFHEENARMTTSRAEMPGYLHETRDLVLDEALPNVAFDGWSEALLRDAIMRSGADVALAQLTFPRGVVDLAAEAHRRDDRLLLDRIDDLEGLRIRDKITTAIKIRLQLAGGNEDAVRRAVALFALPHHAAEGARLTWETADVIWCAIGDTSTDYNWYTKRLTLSGVYSATLLYWLGDASIDKQDTWSFLDRRIEDVMRIEKAKAAVRKSPAARALLAGPKALLNRLSAPLGDKKADGLAIGFPGRS